MSGVWEAAGSTAGGAWEAAGSTAGELWPESPLSGRGDSVVGQAMGGLVSAGGRAAERCSAVARSALVPAGLPGALVDTLVRGTLLLAGLLALKSLLSSLIWVSAAALGCCLLYQAVDLRGGGSGGPPGGASGYGGGPGAAGGAAGAGARPRRGDDDLLEVWYSE